MTWWKKLLGGDGDSERVDYYQEGVELLKVQKYHEALTSFRLALRETPNDLAVLQQIAIAYTKIGMTDEAAKTYRTVLDRHPEAVGAHYGLAFLLLQEGKQDEAIDHLRQFLASPPGGQEVAQHVRHAQQKLEELTRAPAGEDSGEVTP